MKESIEKYVQDISEKFRHQETSELGYRTDFEILLQKIFESIKVKRIDHDARTKDGNKPDFAVLSGDIPLVYIETKDIGVSLDKVEKSEQMSRYYGYANLVLTDYLEFRFYRNGLRYCEPIKIGSYDLKNRLINKNSDNFDLLSKTFIDFPKTFKEPIKSGNHLSKIMGGKARILRDNIRQFYSLEKDRNTDLIKLYETLKKLLVHDLTISTFADMYAQTLVYGLFVARFYDDSLGSFSRHEAQELIPNSNPFLKHFFDHIVGADFDNRLKYVVDELCEVFSHSNIQELMKQYYKIDLWGEKHDSPDPVIHFYEDFLQEYDPELKRKMGAYYTPQPVVDFIVNSVDDLIKNDFNLADGLADKAKNENGLHKVQVLDPATGTGTFISAIIRKIYIHLKDRNQLGTWGSYVHNDLLPRIFGFELMIAPYTIAHLKLGIEFRRSKFWDFHRRLGIFLTNSLEESTIQQDGLFAFGLAESIAEESKEASKIKNENPIMVVIGNPPYSGISSNETKYANSLVERYKVEPGGKQKLQESKHWLNDDYVKFIAMAESMVEKNGDGIIGMITNNGYLDNPSFRGMRWHLAKTFDKIFVLDLHGNSKKLEKAPDGSKDQNVFDIMQGVGIILAVKTGDKKIDKLAEVFHSEIYGSRKHKFDELKNNPKWKKLLLDEKMLYFVPKNIQGINEYEKGFKVNNLFVKKSTGIVTMGDDFIINENKATVEERVSRLAQGIFNESTLNSEFKLGKNYSKFITEGSSRLAFDDTKLIKVDYRPFDKRWSYFDNKVIWRWRNDVMSNFINHDNLGLLFTRMTKGKDFAHVFVTKNVSEVIYLSPLTGTNAFNAPLYIHHEDETKTSNLNQEIVSKIDNIVGITHPENIFDYIYAVLHSPDYRQKYNEFLKIDFPIIPYPKNKEQFVRLTELGKELRELHLLESPKLNSFITSYSIEGNDILERIEYKNGNVYINENQYFGDAPEVAWYFNIGGYQPAQKWLKDRKGRQLNNDDIEHYQKIIVSLVETDKVMKKINEIEL